VIKTARWQRVLGYLVGLSVLGLLVYMGGDRAIQTTLRPTLGFVLLSFLANVFLLATSSVRLGYVINSMERYKVCSYYRYFVCFVTGRFFSTYLPQTGSDFLLRPGLLNRIAGVTLRRGIYATLVEKIFDSMLVLSVIPSAVLYLLNIIPGYGVFFIVLAFLGIVLSLIMRGSSVFLIVVKRVLLWLYIGLSKLPLLNRLTRNEHLEDLRKTLGLLERRGLLIIFAMTLVRQLFLVCQLYFLVAALSLSIPFAILFVGIAIAQSSMLFAFTPGGLGILEGGWYAVLAVAGIPEAERVAFLIGQRAYSFIFISLISIASYLVFAARRLFS